MKIKHAHARMNECRRNGVAGKEPEKNNSNLWLYERINFDCDRLNVSDKKNAR